MKVTTLQQQILNIKEKIDRLALTWTLDNDRQETDYEYLLGDGSLERMRGLLQDVQACELEASRSLRAYWEASAGKCDIREMTPRHPEDLNAFDKWLKHTRSASKDKTNHHYAMRAAFAFVKGEDLERKVGHFKKKINLFEDFLKNRFEYLPDIAPDVIGKSLKPEYFRAVLSLRDHSKSVVGQLSQLSEEAWASQVQCSIVPRLKDREGHIARYLDPCMGDLTMTLSLHTGLERESGYSKLPQLTLPLIEESTPAELFSKVQRHESKGARATRMV